MIYILTGVAKSGKSLVTKKVIETMRIPVIQTDHIMMMLHKANPSLGLNIDASDSSVARFLEPYLEALIETMIENKRDYVMEGVHFLTSFSHRLLEKFPQDIRVLYLVYAHADPIKKAHELLEHAHNMENPWFLSMKGEDYHHLVRYLVDESKRLEQECMLYHLPFIEIENIIFQMDDVLHQLFD